MKAATDSPSTVRPSRGGLGTAATLALALIAVASMVVAAAAVFIAVEVHGQDRQSVAESTSNAAILAALQSLAADRGAAATQAPAGEPAPTGEVEPAPEEGAPTAPAVVAPGPVPAASGAPAPQGTAVPAPEPAASAPQTPTPSAEQLTATLHSAVDPANSLSYRRSHVERGAEAGPVLEQIGARAGTMLQVVQPRVVDPIDFDGTAAAGRLQVTFAGAPGPETPLRLTFVYLDGMWKLSARSVCDVASFNGFSCPSGYVR
ncbi:hypothetical protein EV641_105292 [Rhodococcus sp. SMB37]|uniref:hypothetical protein n=1 Tax=Rhodococcus sp. SMB37 TaxID=2512213 RepID=UPI0010458B9C|nr:hypothetical protein [Rhodococcus sp. SMB37]TCN54267.1 hypothetical protein EV641_105292 [Rhodococcus sp. SMB37]